MSEQFQAAMEKDAQFKRGSELVNQLLSSNAPALNPQDRADVQYFLNQYEPYRQKIVLGLKRPNKTVLEFRQDWSFSEMTQFRQFARYDAYLMKQAHARKDFNPVVSLYEEGMTLRDGSSRLQTEDGTLSKTLQEAGVQDLNVDPYTGGEFVYKVNLAKGFLIYSVGADEVDDGGWLAKSRMDKGDVSYRTPVRKENDADEDAPIWLK